MGQGLSKVQLKAELLESCNRIDHLTVIGMSELT